jgi:hypothetical protein
MHRSRPLASLRRASLALVAVALLSFATSPAQTVVAAVSTLGPGCGSPAAALSSTIPVVGGDITFHLETGAPGSICDLFLSPPPIVAPLDLGFGCMVYVNPALFFPLGPFVTDAGGALTVTYSLPDVPELVNLFCSLQSLVLAPGPVYPFGVSNGVGLLDGNASPFCSYSQGGYQGSGVPGTILTNNFATVFAGAGFMEVGVYDAGGGAAAPNGIRFTANVAGVLALKTFLGGGGSSSAFGIDAVNPLSSGGGLNGGTLGKQACVLALNVAFNNAGVVGSALPGYTGLVYYGAPGDALNGFTVTQILGVANNALAGLGLPAGYTFGALNTLVANINLAFDPCVMSAWARLHLFAS